MAAIAAFGVHTASAAPLVPKTEWQMIRQIAAFGFFE